MCGGEHLSVTLEGKYQCEKTQTWPDMNIIKVFVMNMMRLIKSYYYFHTTSNDSNFDQINTTLAMNSLVILMSNP